MNSNLDVVLVKKVRLGIKEGDKKTPKGTFELDKLYFRKDRKEKPSTSLKCIEIKKNMGWCDDVRFPKIYNKLIKIKKKLNMKK